MAVRSERTESASTSLDQGSGNSFTRSGAFLVGSPWAMGRGGSVFTAVFIVESGTINMQIKFVVIGEDERHVGLRSGPQSEAPTRCAPRG